MNNPEDYFPEIQSLKVTTTKVTNRKIQEYYFPEIQSVKVTTTKVTDRKIQEYYFCECCLSSRIICCTVLNICSLREMSIGSAVD